MSETAGMCHRVVSLCTIIALLFWASGLPGYTAETETKIVPLPKTTDPELQKAAADAEAELAELNRLREATLCRSPEIKAIANKMRISVIDLRPVVQEMYKPRLGCRFGSSPPGTPSAWSAWTEVQERTKTRKLTESEQVTMFMNIRACIDKVEFNFRQYKQNVDWLRQLTTSTAGKAIDSGDSNITGAKANIKMFRTSLVELAGEDAVAGLDQWIECSDKSNKSTAL